MTENSNNSKTSDVENSIKENARNKKRLKYIISGVVVSAAIAGIIFYFYTAYSIQHEKILSLQGTVQKVEEENKVKDKYIEEVAGAISQLQTSLNVVGENQLIISDLSQEIRTGTLSPSQAKDKIVTSISIIDSIIKSSRNQIKSLQAISAARKKKIGRLSKTILSLENTIVEMRQAIENKELEIVSLKNEIQKLVEKVVSLTEEVEEKNKLLKTAYYIVGQEKELFKQKIIKYEGGILGLIATTPVVESKLPDDIMTKINIEEFSEISIERDINSIKILTSHSPDTYKLIKDEENKNKSKLTIQNPYRFWMRSKYLVVLFY